LTNAWNLVQHVYARVLVNFFESLKKTVDRRCRSRQDFGGVKEFCPNFTKFARKIFVRQTFHEDQKRHEDQKECYGKIVISWCFIGHVTNPAVASIPSLKSRTHGAPAAPACFKVAELAVVDELK